VPYKKFSGTQVWLRLSFIPTYLWIAYAQSLSRHTQGLKHLGASKHCREHERVDANKHWQGLKPSGA